MYNPVINIEPFHLLKQLHEPSALNRLVRTAVNIKAICLFHIVRVATIRFSKNARYQSACDLLSNHTIRWFVLYVDVVYPLFKRHCKVKVTDKQANVESSQPWFNLECYEKRKIFYRTLNEYRNNNSEENRSSMVSVRSQYKQCLRSDKKQTVKRTETRVNNAKLYPFHWTKYKKA